MDDYPGFQGTGRIAKVHRLARMAILKLQFEEDEIDFTVWKEGLEKLDQYQTGDVVTVRGYVNTYTRRGVGKVLGLIVVEMERAQTDE